ncbi:hypothetical protein ACH42_06855 [Endozoicomonas sp. (ex Bugula neritina AB1)]|nr:hypothetical protein ACH42_06855 [Endozoicomonas sp. (ex Bugula neritina AB1)]
MSGNNSVSSALVPLQQRPLLLPIACIIDVLDYRRPEETDADISWFLGNTHWRSQNIPVISFERLNQRQFAEFSATNRIMIIRRTTEECSIPYYGVVIQGMPQTQTITEKDIIDSSEETGPAEKMQILFKEVPVILPDLGFIEEKLSEVLAPAVS